MRERSQRWTEGGRERGTDLHQLHRMHGCFVIEVANVDRVIDADGSGEISLEAAFGRNMKVSDFQIQTCGSASLSESSAGKCSQSDLAGSTGVYYLHIFCFVYLFIYLFIYMHLAATWPSDESTQLLNNYKGTHGESWASSSILFAKSLAKA